MPTITEFRALAERISRRATRAGSSPDKTTGLLAPTGDEKLIWCTDVRRYWLPEDGDDYGDRVDLFLHRHFPRRGPDADTAAAWDNAGQHVLMCQVRLDEDGNFLRADKPPHRLLREYAIAVIDDDERFPA